MAVVPRNSADKDPALLRALHDFEDFIERDAPDPAMLQALREFHAPAERPSAAPIAGCLHSSTETVLQMLVAANERQEAEIAWLSEEVRTLRLERQSAPAIPGPQPQTLALADGQLRELADAQRSTKEEARVEMDRLRQDVEQRIRSEIQNSGAERDRAVRELEASMRKEVLGARGAADQEAVASLVDSHSKHGAELSRLQRELEAARASAREEHQKDIGRTRQDLEQRIERELATVGERLRQSVSGQDQEVALKNLEALVRKDVLADMRAELEKSGRASREQQQSAGDAALQAALKSVQSRMETRLDHLAGRLDTYVAEAAASPRSAAGAHGAAATGSVSGGSGAVTSGGMFGGGSFGTPAVVSAPPVSSAGGLFGPPAGLAGTGSSSLFGGGGGGVFGGVGGFGGTGNVFAAPKASVGGGIFGGGSSPSSGSLFTSVGATGGMFGGGPAASVFGAASATATGGLFGASANGCTENAFGAGGAFGGGGGGAPPPEPKAKADDAHSAIGMEAVREQNEELKAQLRKLEEQASASERERRDQEQMLSTMQDQIRSIQGQVGSRQPSSPERFNICGDDTGLNLDASRISSPGDGLERAARVAKSLETSCESLGHDFEIVREETARAREQLDFFEERAGAAARTQRVLSRQLQEHSSHMRALDMKSRRPGDLNFADRLLKVKCGSQQAGPPAAPRRVSTGSGSASSPSSPVAPLLRRIS